MSPRAQAPVGSPSSGPVPATRASSPPGRRGAALGGVVLLDPDVPAGAACRGAAEVGPAMGQPADRAATLVAEAKTGRRWRGWSRANQSADAGA